MFSFLARAPKNSRKNDATPGVLKVAEKELHNNKEAIESLRDYDAGKKDISTADVERHLRDV